MMYYRKGFWYIVLFLAVSLLSLAVTAKPQNLDMEKYWDGYTYYLEQVAGQYSSEKATYIEKEAQNIAEASKLREELLDRYYDGELTLREFEQRFSELETVLQYQQGFEVLYDQYLYISENTENRFFLPTNGWNGLFEQNVFPFLLFQMILVLIVPVFCSEIGNQMDILICTTKEGKKAVFSQMMLAGSVAVLLCFLDGIIRFVFFDLKYGLPYGDAPLQSLSYFGDYTGKVSLMDGYWNMVLLRCIGGFILAVFILFVSVLVRKYALTLLITASAVLLPYLALTSNQIHHVELSQYDNIIIGTPCWFGTYAPAINTFLSENPMKGKRIHIFVCNGGNLRKTWQDFENALSGNVIVSKLDLVYPLKNGIRQAKEKANAWIRESLVKT